MKGLEQHSHDTGVAEKQLFPDAGHIDAQALWAIFCKYPKNHHQAFEVNDYQSPNH